MKADWSSRRDLSRPVRCVDINTADSSLKEANRSSCDALLKAMLASGLHWLHGPELSYACARHGVDLRDAKRRA